MKRMQAIVTGKKKQCTKIPPPLVTSPGVNTNGKKISQNGNTVSDNVSKATPSSNNNHEDVKDKPEEGHSVIHKTESGLAKPGSKGNQASPRRAVASLESSPGMVRKSSGGSKIPASAPKRDGSTKRTSSPSKTGRTRKDLEENKKTSKSSGKSQGPLQRLARKASFRDKKQQADKERVSTSSSTGTDATETSRPERSNSSASKNGDETKIGNSNRLGKANVGVDSGTEAGDSQSSSSHSSTNTQGKAVRSDGTNTAQHTHRDTAMPTVSKDPRSRLPLTSDAEAPSPISPPKGEGARSASSPSDKPEKKRRVEDAREKDAPLHGILKESKRYAYPELADHQDCRYNTEANSHPSSIENHGHGPLSWNSDRAHNGITSQNNVFRTEDNGVYSQINFHSMPRTSRSITPVKESQHAYGHGYNSLPRKAHIDYTSHGHHKINNNPDFNSWGSIPTRSDSESGYGGNTLERSFGSTGSSSNTRGFPSHGHSLNPVSHNYVSQGNPNYVTGYTNHPRRQLDYHKSPPRPDSVPPIGTSKHSLTGSMGDVFYDTATARPGSVPPQHPANMYGYHSESEAADRNRMYPPTLLHRAHRSGSVPIGYETEASAYGHHAMSSAHNPIYDRAPNPHYTHTSLPPHPNSGRVPGGLRVHPGDERYRADPGKKAIPRRHTVGGARNQDAKTIDTASSKTEQKREAFMQLLAQRYPQYADRIQGSTTGSGTGSGAGDKDWDRTASSSSASPSPQPPEPDKPARSRDVQRRRTALASYDPVQAAHALEYEDLGTMSDLELPSFQRGGFMRTSLPMARSASTSLERPLGLVFLVCSDQTKKSLLPNEITSLDTVRALFVRAFPDLNMEMLESPRRKIYILDPATNIYFQLEDLAEIKDRSVLKLHETDNNEPQRVKERQEVRGRTVQMPHQRSQPRQPLYDVVPPPDMDQYDPNTRRSRSRTPEPAERPRSLSAGASSRQRISHSPDRTGAPPMNSLNPIPENRQFLAQHHPGYRRDPPPHYYDHNNDPSPVYGVVGLGGHYSVAHPTQPVVYDSYDNYASLPHHAVANNGVHVPSQPHHQQTYVARSTRAPPLAHPQRAVAPGPDMRDGVRATNSRQSPVYSPSPADPGPGVYQQRHMSHTPSNDAASRNRIEKMEQQLATLTAWVHLQKTEKNDAEPGMGPRRDIPPPPRSMSSLPSTASGSTETFPGSTASSITDVPHGYTPSSLGHGSSASSVNRSDRSDTSTPVPTLGAGIEAKARLAELRKDLQVVRRQQQLGMEAMREEISAAWSKIKKVINTVPGSDRQVLVHKRTQVNVSKCSYLNDKQQVDKELSDLEASVEEQRNDVISRRCRVNIADVEGMALLLSNITKSLADLKGRFPKVHAEMKDVMDAEMRVVVAEEKFLKAEPTEIETSLKRCKNLTQTLYTLKRLASAQDLQPPHIPDVAGSTAPDDDLQGQKHAVLESIKAMIPDHQQRVEHMEAAEASRERKKKISTQQEALKFGKSLEMASKQLKPTTDHNDVAKDNMNNNPNLIKPTYNHKSEIVKPSVASKPSLSMSGSALPYSSSVSPTPPSSLSPKLPFSAALTTQTSSPGRAAEKPTATVSAMTAHVSDSITTTAAKSHHESAPPSSYHQGSSDKHQPMIGGSTVTGGMGTVTQTVHCIQSPVSQKAEADISTYQVCGPVNPVIPTNSPQASRPSSLAAASSSHSSLYGSPPGSPGFVADMAIKESFDKPRSAVNGSPIKPCLSSPSHSSSSSATSPVEASMKKPSVTFAESTSSIPMSSSQQSPSIAQKDNNSNCNSDSVQQSEQDKVDLASQKQAARNAFFSSLSSPPVTPTSPGERNSAVLDAGPVVSPGLVGKVTPGSTINLVLAGSASPKSSNHPGTFTISPPADITLSSLDGNNPASDQPVKKFFIPSSPSSQKSPTLVPSRQIISSSSSSTSRKTTTLITTRQLSLDSQHTTSKPAPLAGADTSSSSSESSDYAGAKPKKIPPPPPPRKGSRPTSVGGIPGLSNNSSPSHTNIGDTPRFVGGILGQHRLSGGPLSSTPKSGSYNHDRPAMSRFESDIASGLVSNMNRPDLQGQNTNFQQVMSKAESTTTKPSNGSVKNQGCGSDRLKSSGIPPPPSVTLSNTGNGGSRQERGSSAESTGSSSSGSGSALGSQQSVVSVVRAQSVTTRPASKPDPPKRQSSLLAKFTGAGSNRKGVDL